MSSRIRIAHIADTHLDVHRRLDDTKKVLDEFAYQAKAADVDLFAHAGDFFHRRSCPDERNLLAEFVRNCSSHASFYGVRGNHDRLRDIDIYNLLDPEITPGDGQAGGSEIALADHPSVVTHHGRRGALTIALLPWFDKSGVVNKMNPGESIQITDDVVNEASRRLVQAMGFEIKANQTKASILIGHILVRESTVSTGQELEGSTYEIPANELLELSGASYCALGHIHKRQDWLDGRVAYSGSTERTNFGEDEAKGWNLVEIDLSTGEHISTEFVELPARQILLFEDDFVTGGRLRRGVDDKLPLDGRRNVDGALVRYRYKVRSRDIVEVDAEVERIEKALLDAGAYSVKLDPIIVHDERVRCEDIRQATTTWDKLCAYWKEAGTEIDDETRNRLRDKLATIEGRAA